MPAITRPAYPIYGVFPHGASAGYTSRMRIPRFLAFALLPLAACAPAKGTSTAQPTPAAAATPAVVHVYTSMYREVVDAVAPAVDAKLAKTMPGVKVDWFQGGSEKVATRLDGELASGASPCDVLLTSDPAYYRKLKGAGKLVAYDSPEASREPAGYRDADHAWATARFSTMVIGLSPETASGDNGPVPSSFSDLADPARKLRIAIGDPGYSGTNLTTVAILSKRIGWDFYKSLHAKRAVVAGGNSTVLQRLDTATSDAGIVLLENLLAARDQGSKVGVVYPKEGAILIPGLISLLPDAKDSKAARAVYDAILSPDVQKVIVDRGFMHAGDPGLPPPTGAPALEKLLGAAPLGSIYEPPGDVDQVKGTFNEIFARQGS